MLPVLYFLRTEDSKQKQGQTKDITDDENRRNLEREAREEMLSQEQDRHVAEPRPILDTAALLTAPWLCFQMAHHDNAPLWPEVT